MNELHLFNARAPWTCGSVLLATRVETFASTGNLDQGGDDEQTKADVVNGVLMTSATSGENAAEGAPSIKHFVEFLAVIDPARQRREVADLDEGAYKTLIQSGTLTGTCFTLFLQQGDHQMIHSCFLGERYEITPYPASIYMPPFLEFTRNDGLLGPTIWSRIQDGTLNVVTTNSPSGERVVTVSGPMNHHMDMRLVLVLDPDRGHGPVRVERWIRNSYVITEYTDFIEVGEDHWFPKSTTVTAGFLAAEQMNHTKRTDYHVINRHVVIEDLPALEVYDLESPDSIASALLAPRS